MISVIVTTLNDEKRLSATLAALSSAAMDGLVREVIVADGGSADGTLDIAAEAGARVISGRRDRVLGEARAAARQPWQLILPAGARLQVGWEQAALSHIRRRPKARAWFTLSLADEGLSARMDELMANTQARLFGRLRPEHGLLIPSAARKGPRPPAHGLPVRILVGSSPAPVRGELETVSA